jgi:hypothetical protein
METAASLARLDNVVNIRERKYVVGLGAVALRVREAGEDEAPVTCEPVAGDGGLRLVDAQPPTVKVVFGDEAVEAVTEGGHRLGPGIAEKAQSPAGVLPGVPPAVEGSVGFCCRMVDTARRARAAGITPGSPTASA